MCITTASNISLTLPMISVVDQQIIARVAATLRFAIFVSLGGIRSNYDIFIVVISSLLLHLWNKSYEFVVQVSFFHKFFISSWNIFAEIFLSAVQQCYKHFMLWKNELLSVLCHNTKLFCSGLLKVLQKSLSRRVECKTSQALAVGNRIADCKGIYLCHSKTLCLVITN